MRQTIYTVTGVNAYIKNMFDQDFLLKKIQIKGEVSNFKRHSSGHIYFSLKDDSTVMSAVMFKSRVLSGLGFPMQNGDDVIVTGSVGVYPERGQYQIYAQKIQLDGEGAIQKKYEQLKKDLQEMGMFDVSYKQPIPKYIRTLGVVTSSTGAVIQDICNVAGRRNPYVRIVLYPAKVQGDRAALELVKGLRALEEYGVDTIIIGRGGGSTEDLWVFNEEVVARAIFNCRIPVISAVGHQTDDTIADLVADLRAPTPSAAAELAVYDYQQFRESLLSLKYELVRRMRERITKAYKEQEMLYARLQYLSPGSRLEMKKVRLRELEDRLHMRIQHQLQAYKYRLELLAQQLETGSPLKKLSQGYSYVTDKSGLPLKSVFQVQAEDEISICTTDGRIRARVLQVTKEA